MAIIQTPVTYSDESLKVIKDYEATPNIQHQDFWMKKEVSSIKAEIKSHYKTIQNYKCVYCNKKIPVKHSSVWDAEHIVARENSPHFMFTPKNLCIACKDCNGPKSNQNVLTNKSKKNYPANSDDFLIIHPHFDDYQDHIAIYMDKIYSPKTKKGQKTIELCNLLRFSYESVGWDLESEDTPEIVDIASDLLNSPEEDQDRLCMELLMKAQVNLSNTLVRKKCGSQS